MTSEHYNVCMPECITILAAIVDAYWDYKPIATTIQLPNTSHHAVYIYLCSFTDLLDPKHGCSRMNGFIMSSTLPDRLNSSSHGPHPPPTCLLANVFPKYVPAGLEIRAWWFNCTCTFTTHSTVPLYTNDHKTLLKSWYSARYAWKNHTCRRSLHTYNLGYFIHLWMTIDANGSWLVNAQACMQR